MRPVALLRVAEPKGLGSPAGACRGALATTVFSSVGRPPHNPWRAIDGRDPGRTLSLPDPGRRGYSQIGRGVRSFRTRARALSPFGRACAPSPKRRASSQPQAGAGAGAGGGKAGHKPATSKVRRGLTDRARLGARRTFFSEPRVSGERPAGKEGRGAEAPAIPLISVNLECLIRARSRRCWSTFCERRVWSRTSPPKEPR
jgi:hypothetical protein